MTQPPCLNLSIGAINWRGPPQKENQNLHYIDLHKGAIKQNSYKKFLSLQIDDWEVSSILFEIEEETHIHYSWLSTLLLNTRKAA